MSDEPLYPAAGEQEAWLRVGKAIEFPTNKPDTVDASAWEQTRTVPAIALAALVKNDTRSSGVRIRIVNAIISGPLRVTYAVFPFDFSFIDCEFQDEVDLSFCTLLGYCSFRGTRFRKAAKFNSIQARYDLEFDGAQFVDSVTLQAIEVQGRLFSRGTRFVNANFTTARFAKTAVFRPLGKPTDNLIATQFVGETNFSDARFEGTAVFDGAQFLGKADFSRCSFSGSALFRAAEAGDEWITATFSGETLFRECNIGATADFRGAQFGKADFNLQLTRIGGGLYFRPATKNPTDPNPIPVRFAGAALLEGIQVGGRFALDGVQFTGRCSLEAAQIKGNALCRALWGSNTPIRFGGEANFRDVVIEGTADFNGAEFQDKAIFNRTKVRGSAFFNAVKYRDTLMRCSFLGIANFDDVEVQGLLSMLGVRFTTTASFRRLQVKGNASFGPAPLDTELECSEFRETIFTDAHISGLADFSGAAFNGSLSCDRVAIGGAAFFGLGIRGDHLERCRFADGLLFRQATVGGRTDFSGATFRGVIDFSDSKFAGVLAFNTVLRNNQVWVARFDGPATFLRCEITDNLEMVGTYFASSANFESINIRRNALLRASDFSYDHDHQNWISLNFIGDVRFLDANIGGAADFKDAIFMGDANFQRIKVGGPAMFRPSRERDPKVGPIFRRVNFAGAVFSGGADFDNVSVVSDLILTEATFGASSRFSRMTCGGNVDFSLVSVDGTATYQRSKFGRDVSFRDATISIVNFGESETDKTRFAGNLVLSGFSFTRLIADWRDLLTHAQSNDLQPYVQVEKFFRSSGQERDADAVYLARRQREQEATRTRFWDFLHRRGQKGRRDALHDLRLLAEDWIIGGIFNYGVPSYRMLAVALLFFLLGVIVLAFPQALVPLDPNVKAAVQAGSNLVRAGRATLAFLATVLPGEKASLLTHWKPSPFPIYQGSAFTFVQVAALLSWLMYASATIAIASLAGLIKRKPS
jgi:uncharacterized protein YjbI with pentapeptide repeats